MAVTAIVNPAASSNGSPSSAVWAFARIASASTSSAGRSSTPSSSNSPASSSLLPQKSSPKSHSVVRQRPPWYSYAVASDSESIAVKSSPSRSSDDTASADWPSTRSKTSTSPTSSEANSSGSSPMNPAANAIPIVNVAAMSPTPYSAWHSSVRRL